eukprot:14831304-Ditylum_brightwellii.AAC.1
MLSTEISSHLAKPSQGGQQKSGEKTTSPKEDCGDVPIYGVTCLDAPMYQGREPEQVLKKAEKDSMLGDEAKAAEKRMALLLVQSWQQEYSEMARHITSGLKQRPAVEDGVGLELLRPRRDG